MMKKVLVFLLIAAGVTIAYAAGVPQDSVPESPAPAAVLSFESVTLRAVEEEEASEKALDALIRKTHALLPELVRRAEELEIEGRAKEARMLKKRADELGRAIALFERSRKDPRPPVPRAPRAVARLGPKAKRPTMDVTNGFVIENPFLETGVRVVKPGEPEEICEVELLELEDLEEIAEVVELDELEEISEVELLELDEFAEPEEIEEIEVIREGEDLYAKAGARTRALRREDARETQRSRSRARAGAEETVIGIGGGFGGGSLGGSGRARAIGSSSGREARAGARPAPEPRPTREEPRRRIVVTPHIEPEVTVPLKLDPMELALNQKLHHLNLALENLHAAGLHEQAEHIAPHLHAVEEEIHAHRSAQREAPHADAPHQGAPPAPDGALAERIHDLQAEVHGLRSEVKELREMVQELRKHVSTLKRAY